MTDCLETFTLLLSCVLYSFFSIVLNSCGAWLMALYGMSSRVTGKQLRRAYFCRPIMKALSSLRHHETAVYVCGTCLLKVGLVWISVCVIVCMHTHACVCVCVYTCMCVCVCVCVCTCVCVCVCVIKCMVVCMHTHVCVCVHVYRCVCMFSGLHLCFHFTNSLFITKHIISHFG